jgi:NADPH-dependent 2,4-dienoyl-CoA reductase/sulfur reductase-like enzyme
MSLKVIVIGGVAAGPKAAAKIMRLNPEAEVTIVEKGKFISYAGCGLPYYVSGLVKEQKDLMSTPIGVVRDPSFFQKVKNVKVLIETEALEIDRAKKRVRVRRNCDSTDTWLDYDKLVLATGAKPVIPPLPNVTLGNLYAAQRSGRRRHQSPAGSGQATGSGDDRRRIDRRGSGRGFGQTEARLALPTSGSGVTFCPLAARF